MYEFERAERLLGTAVARAPDNPRKAHPGYGEAGSRAAGRLGILPRRGSSRPASLLRRRLPGWRIRALRGDTDGALAHFERLLAQRSTDQGQRAWLLASAAGA